MWNVIQVVTGKEEETKNVIEKELGRQFFKDCFYIVSAEQTENT